MNTLLVALAVVAGVAWLIGWQRRVALRREDFIRTYALPQGLFEQLRKKRPGLDLKQCQLVSLGLRDRRLLRQRPRGRIVGRQFRRWLRRRQW